MPNKKIIFISMVSVLIATIFITGCTYPTILGDNFNPDPNVVIDRTMIPADHAIYGAIALPDGNGTYCLYAETLSRGEPVDISLHYIIQVPRTPDRFSSTEGSQRGVAFTADNNNVVNETITVPIGATDQIITVSYYMVDYINTNRVHVIVKRC